MRSRSLFLLVLSFSLAGIPPGGAWLRGHGAYHDVVADLNTRLLAAPEDHLLRLQLAKAHVEHGEWQPCLDEVATIEKLAPGQHATGSLVGRSLAGLGRSQEALGVLDAHLAQNPDDQSARVARARVRLKLGQVAGGLEDYRAALMTPATAELYVETCEALRRNGEGRAALAVAEEGLKACRADPAILLCAVECAAEVGEVDAALVHLDQLQRVWPRPEPWMQRKAELLGEAGRATEARAAWRTLYDHLLALPNLERAQPFLAETLATCRRALGIEAPVGVVAPPAN
jgi:Flp pilus assembly protein TadD